MAEDEANQAGVTVPPLVTLPPPGAHIHIIGIGGIGTSALARVLALWGYRVTGSDAAPSPITAALEREGIGFTVGHHASAVDGASLVVYSAAVRDENAELAAARAAGIPTLKRAALLGLIANARRGLAVAGTHGKSTTSAMLAKICIDAGRDPSFFVGAILQDFGTNARPGGGELVVVEADEYDRSFLQLFPEVAIVTTLEHDHPDIYPTFGAMQEAYLAFMRQIRPGGTIVLSADDPGCVALRPLIEPAVGVTIQTYGRAERADWRIVLNGDGDLVLRDGAAVARLALAVPGEHNRQNALGALAAAAAVGIAPEVAAGSLGGFHGTGRRFELKGEAGGITVVDDYAHHPTEIAVNLRAVRERYPDRPIWAVFQPHTYSRTQLLLHDFAAALGAADRIVLLDIYAARETDTLGVSADAILPLLPDPTRALRAGRPADAAALLLRERAAGRLAPGAVVLTLGAGDVTEIGAMVLDGLRR
jgi:UDP-N-acetylmuramate--alanine ligase